MTLTFLGFYDQKGIWFSHFFTFFFSEIMFSYTEVSGSREPVRVETLLLQYGHKKRKDVSSPTMQVGF